MTTREQALVYEQMHTMKWGDKPLHIHNPHGKPVEELPCIYGFNNGGYEGWMEGLLVSQDGHILGGHVCSSEAYMPYDLGLLVGARPERQEHFQKHYPDGYRTVWLPHAAAGTHEGLKAAMQLHQLMHTETEKKQ